MISTRFNEREFILYPPYTRTGRYRISSSGLDEYLSFKGEIADLLNMAETPGLLHLITNQIVNMIRTFDKDHEHTAYYRDPRGEGCE